MGDEGLLLILFAPLALLYLLLRMNIGRYLIWYKDTNATERIQKREHKEETCELPQTTNSDYSLNEQMLSQSEKRSESVFLVMEVPINELTLAELEEYRKCDAEVQIFDDVAFIIKQTV